MSRRFHKKQVMTVEAIEKSGYQMHGLLTRYSSGRTEMYFGGNGEKTVLSSWGSGDEFIRIESGDVSIMIPVADADSIAKAIESILAEDETCDEPEISKFRSKRDGLYSQEEIDRFVETGYPASDEVEDTMDSAGWPPVKHTDTVGGK